MIEKWESAELLDAHGEGELVKRLNASLEGLLQRPVEVARHEPILAGSPTRAHSSHIPHDDGGGLPPPSSSRSACVTQFRGASPNFRPFRERSGTFPWPARVLGLAALDILFRLKTGFSGSHVAQTPSLDLGIVLPLSGVLRSGSCPAGSAWSLPMAVPFLSPMALSPMAVSVRPRPASCPRVVYTALGGLHWWSRSMESPAGKNHPTYSAHSDEAARRVQPARMRP